MADNENNQNNQHGSFDYEPTIGEVKSLKPFIFWTQTTLPTVFDDSLSYYEAMSKIAKMLNTLLENENTNAENIIELKKAYDKTKEYVNDYFANLDLSGEVSTKIEEMYDDGRLTDIVVDKATELVDAFLHDDGGAEDQIQALIDDATQAIHDYIYGEDGEGGVNQEIEETLGRANQLLTDLPGQIDDKLDTVPGTVNAWLEDNITQPSSTVIDSSLTLHDAAAEAYATGDAINQARNVALANTDYQSFVTDSIPNQYVMAAYDGTNARIATDSSSDPLRPMKIANVTPGETYLISCVGGTIGPNQFAPAYAYVEKTEDLQGNIVRTIVDIYPRTWTGDVQYEIIRNRYITVPELVGYNINEIILMSNTDIAVDATCTRLVVKMDSSLTSQVLPAQGKAVGDALYTKLPWPVADGSKDVGTSGKHLASNGDGTTRWEESSSGTENLEKLINSVSNKTDILLETVNYDYDNQESFPEDASSNVAYKRIGIERNYSQITLNISNPVTSLLRCKISGEVARASTNSGTQGFTNGIALIAGHIYKVESLFVSGSVQTTEGANPPSCGIIKVGTAASINSTYFDGLNSWGEFVAPEENVNLVMRVQSGTTLINAVWQVILRDITAMQESELLSTESEMLKLHTVPDNFGVLNAIKRARQLTDIVWSPVEDIPRVFYTTGKTMSEPHTTYRGKFAAGKVYEGLPYTLTKLVGLDVSIDTFVTSVVNPLSAEIIDSVYASSDRPSLYGTVCTGLTSYALGLPYIQSDYWQDVSDVSRVGSVNSLAFENYKLGDILQTNGHCCIVTDIDTNQRRIEISEGSRYGNTVRSVTDGEKGSLCRRFFLDYSGLKSYYAGFSVLRYANIDKVDYYQSDFPIIAVDEPKLAYKYLPVMPYEGDMASYSTYRVGPTVKLVIADTNYTHVVVLKNGVPYNEDGTGNPYPISGANFVNVLCEQAEAVYNAYLITKNGDNITESSVWCEWYCRPYFAPTVSIDNGIATFTFTVKSGVYKPFYVSFGSTSPVLGNFIMLFDGDYTSVENSDGTTTYSFSVPYPDNSPTVGQLAYKSEKYGSARLTWNLQ